MKALFKPHFFLRYTITQLQDQAYTLFGSLLSILYQLP